MNRKNLDETIIRVVRRTINEVGEGAIRRKYYNKISRAIQPLTSHIYRDDYWAGKDVVLQAISKIQGVMDLSIRCEHGGYRSNDQAQWKEYIITVETEEGVDIDFVLKCFAAGTMDNPFGAYDMVLSL